MVGCIIGMLIPIKYVVKFRRWLNLEGGCVMDNTIKLLTAFIEASGYDIEEVTESVEVPDKSRPEVGVTFTSKKVIDYKVTKKVNPLDVMFDGFPLKILVNNIIEISANPLLDKRHKWIKYPEHSFNAVVDYFMVKDCVVNNEYCLILGVKVSIDD